MCRGEQWSSFLGQLLGLNEALSLGSKWYGRVFGTEDGHV